MPIAETHSVPPVPSVGRFVVFATTVAVVLAVSACSNRLPADRFDQDPAIAARLPEKVDYNFHVKPILSDRCYACHGPDENKRKGGLRLDVESGATAKLESGGRAIVSGSAAKSLLVRRIVSHDPEFSMPPPESNLHLDDYERATIIRWIKQGAQFKPHWAFIPPVRPEPPATTAPDADPVDRFVVAGLEQAGLSPAPEADREQLIRRLSFDLRGLPPTIAEIDTFLSDDSPDAYEHLVDRLLADEAYGENMAAEWLDIARYADSHGYQDDGLRNMWPWRDWVIRAFNDNMPYDEFVTVQLAGDLLPDHTRDQLLATGFNRNHLQSQEGGIVPEEYRVDYVADRTNTLGRAFLGLNVECARCHDHKFDPISQKEYYELFAFFNSVKEFGNIPYAGEASPTVILTSADADRELENIDRKIDSLEVITDPAHKRFDAPYAAWLRGVRATGNIGPDLAKDLIGHYPLDDAIERKIVNLADRDKDGYLWGDADKSPIVVDGKISSALKLVGDPWIDMGKEVAWFERNEPFSLALWTRITDDGLEGPLFNKSGGLFNGMRGYVAMLNEDGTLSASLNHVFPANSIEVQTVDPLPKGRWMHFAMTYDGSSKASGIHLYLDGERLSTRVNADNLRMSILYQVDPRTGERSNWGDAGNLRIGWTESNAAMLDSVEVDEFMVYGRFLTDVEVLYLAGDSTAFADGARPDVADGVEHSVPVPVRKAGYDEGVRNRQGVDDAQPDKPRVNTVDGRGSAAVDGPAAHGPAGEGNERRESNGDLRAYYVWNHDPDFRRDFALLTELRGDENEILTRQPEVMVMEDLDEPRKTFVLNRGAYDAPGAVVHPSAPSALLPFDESLPKDRRGLAKWLLDPTHPLTSRVAVNRMWQRFFGRGLVATPDDFGNQGARPTHPELLDWLAVEFISSGWDIKALQKLIVMSATYRQSSRAEPRELEVDPANELLARGPSFRLTAEQIRDNALAASGLLNPEVGGEPVKPYQPAGLWKELATRNATEYVPDTGSKLYRRTLYTIWKRTTPPPAMVSFDAADRNVCTVRRQTTNTPLQALVLLNDPQFVEAARVLGERVIKEQLDAASRLTLAFRRLTSRRPDADQLALLSDLLEKQRAVFAEKPERALRLLAVGEWPRDVSIPAVEAAAYAVVVSTIMSFDEAVIRR